MRLSWRSNHRPSWDRSSLGASSDLHLSRLRLDEGKREADGGDDVARAGCIGRRDPIEFRPVDATDRRHPREVLRRSRFGSRIPAGDEDERGGDACRRYRHGPADQRGPMSRHSHQRALSSGRALGSTRLRRAHSGASSPAGRRSRSTATIARYDAAPTRDAPDDLHPARGHGVVRRRRPRRSPRRAATLTPFRYR